MAWWPFNMNTGTVSIPSSEHLAIRIECDEMLPYQLQLPLVSAGHGPPHPPLYHHELLCLVRTHHHHHPWYLIILGKVLAH
jgi:hypothetical protein